MTKPVAADFKARFPSDFQYGNKVGEVSDPMIQGLIDRAWELHSQTTGGCLLAAAHLHCNDALPSALDGGAGVVSKETLGRKSVEYSTNAGEDERRAFWSTSKYGREFMLVEQRNTAQAFGMIIGAP